MMPQKRLWIVETGNWSYLTGRWVQSQEVHLGDRWVSRGVWAEPEESGQAGESFSFEVDSQVDVILTMQQGQPVIKYPSHDNMIRYRRIKDEADGQIKHPMHTSPLHQIK